MLIAAATMRMPADSGAIASKHRISSSFPLSLANASHSGFNVNDDSIIDCHKFSFFSIINNRIVNGLSIPRGAQVGRQRPTSLLFNAQAENFCLYIFLRLAAKRDTIECMERKSTRARTHTHVHRFYFHAPSGERGR